MSSSPIIYRAKASGSNIKRVGLNNLSKFSEIQPNLTQQMIQSVTDQSIIQTIDNYSETMDQRLNNVITIKKQQFQVSYQKLRVLVGRADLKLRKLNTMASSGWNKNDESYSEEFNNVRLQNTILYNQQLSVQVSEIHLQIQDHLKQIKDKRKQTQEKQELVRQLLQDHLQIREQYTLKQSEIRQNDITEDSYQTKTARSVSTKRITQPSQREHTQPSEYGLETPKSCSITSRTQKLNTLRRNLQLVSKKVALTQKNIQERILFNNSLIKLFRQCISDLFNYENNEKIDIWQQFKFQQQRPSQRLKNINFNSTAVIQNQFDPWSSFKAKLNKKRIQISCDTDFSLRAFTQMPNDEYKDFIEDFHQVIAYKLAICQNPCHQRARNIANTFQPLLHQ